MKSCPVCRLFLAAMEWRGHTLLACSSCGGLWLEAAVAECLAAADISDIADLAAVAPHASSVGFYEGLVRLCPVCITARLEPDAEPGMPGVTSRCPQCSGVWLHLPAAAPTHVPSPSEPPAPEPPAPAPVEAPDDPPPGPSQPSLAIEVPEPPCSGPDDAWRRLEEGNARFAGDVARRPRQSRARADEVLDGQQPFAIVVCCSDSRVPPEIVFDQGIGDLFVVRTAGHVTATSAVASVLYAVDHLGVTLVVVLGHTDCGAVKATLVHAEAQSPYAAPLTREIGPAAELARALSGDHLRNTVRMHAARTADRIREAITLRLAGQVGAGTRVVAAVYDLGSRLVERLPESQPQEPPVPPRVVPDAVAAAPAPEKAPAPEADVVPPGDAAQSRYPHWCPKCRAGYDEHTAFCTRCGVMLVQPWYKARCPRCRKENLIGQDRCWNCRTDLHPEWLAAGKRPPRPPAVGVGGAPPSGQQKSTGCSTGVVAALLVGAGLLALLATLA